MVNERRGGCFSGYRLNCEAIPCLPARIVADCLADPRQILHLLIWTRRSLPADRAPKGLFVPFEPKEDVRLARTSFRGESVWVQVERWDGTRISLQVAEHLLPRHGGKDLLLVCNCCQRPRRALYGREAIKYGRYMKPAPWLCRKCASLSYASEGGALIYRTRWAPARTLSGMHFWTRPEPWEPLVFTSPDQALGCTTSVTAAISIGKWTVRYRRTIRAKPFSSRRTISNVE
jgi:hypothetical protein